MSVDTRATVEEAVTTDVANKTEITIPVVKFTWDGVNLSEEWSYISAAEMLNAVGRRNMHVMRLK